MSTKIRVGNLSGSISSSALAEMFGQHGRVRSVKLIERLPSRRCVGFVVMDDATAAKAAITAIEGSKIGGRDITIREARPRDAHRRNADLGSGRSGGSSGRFGDQSNSGLPSSDGVR